MHAGGQPKATVTLLERRSCCTSWHHTPQASALRRAPCTATGTQASKLAHVDLCGNQLRRVGAVAVAKAVAAACPGLSLLALDENMVSEAGLDEVGV